jgi:hypothetical protein
MVKKVQLLIVIVLNEVFSVPNQDVVLVGGLVFLQSQVG